MTHAALNLRASDPPPVFGPADGNDRFDGDAAFAAMRKTYAAAAAAHAEDVRTATFRFAGRPVRFTVVGRELFAHIVEPFAHLRVAEAPDPQLTVELWDDSRVGALPAPERAGGDTLWRERTLRSDDDRYLAQQLPHTMSCLDRAGARLVAGIAWHDRIFIYERSKPFARLLLTWFNDRQMQLIHTGLVARDGTGVLIAGKSGSGKSTSTLACAMDGLDCLSEDYVGLEFTPEGRFVGHSIYNSVFLYSSHLRRFPQLAAHAFHGRPPQEEKSVVMLSQVIPDRLARSADLRAIVFPRVGESPDAQIAPMAKGAALLSLAPSSLLQIPNRYLGAPGFDRLARLVERLPCYEMSVGTNFASIPRCIDALIDRVAAR